MFKILLMYPRGFSFYKLFDIPSYIYLCKSSFTMYNIREGHDVFFPNCVKNVRVHALSDSVKLSRRSRQKMLDLFEL